MGFMNRHTADSVLMFLAHPRAKEMKNSCSLWHQASVRMVHLVTNAGLPCEVQPRECIFTTMSETTIILCLPGTVRLDKTSVTNILSRRPMLQR